MSAKEVPRGWFSVSEAAAYVGVSQDLVREAIAQERLPAYEKPLTRGRKPGATRENRFYKVAREDVDAWVRSWVPYEPRTSYQPPRAGKV